MLLDWIHSVRDISCMEYEDGCGCGTRDPQTCLYSLSTTLGGYLDVMWALGLEETELHMYDIERLIQRHMR